MFILPQSKSSTYPSAIGGERNLEDYAVDGFYIFVL
jgi:hypothetical protein